ncbi:MAG: hypothetical protein FWH02_03740 [Oscillospiraceae bacterium]|nr:hypothetical protein [Oscillospiraceae bacterium]
MFPRTEIGGLSVSRMIIGTNNIMGGSHRTVARDVHIKGVFGESAEVVADVVGAYLEHGVDTSIGGISQQFIRDGIKIAEERAGKKVTKIDLVVFDTKDTPEARRNALDVIKRSKQNGADICLPLHMTVEKLVNKQERKIERISDYLYMIREQGMVPGLSAHMPEIITYTDENGYDAETYIQIYNAAGFLMQIEIELVQEIIWKAKKPVLTIKPMAAGHLNPFVGMNFSWNTIRPQDMVAVGCMTLEEAHETVEYSLAAIERRFPDKVPSRGHGY